MVQFSRLFDILRENALGAHDIKYVGHYEKSLCSDDDQRKMKVISSDLIALLCRLLITICVLNHIDYSVVQFVFLSNNLYFTQVNILQAF